MRDELRKLVEKWSHADDMVLIGSGRKCAIQCPKCELESLLSAPEAAPQVRKLEQMDGTDWKYDYRRDRAWIDGREFAPVIAAPPAAEPSKGGDAVGGAIAAPVSGLGEGEHRASPANETSAAEPPAAYGRSKSMDKRLRAQGMPEPAGELKELAKAQSAWTGDWSTGYICEHCGATNVPAQHQCTSAPSKPEGEGK